MKKDALPKMISLDNMLVRITQQHAVYRRDLIPEHRSFIPADVDAGKLPASKLFARGEEPMQERLGNLIRLKV